MNSTIKININLTCFECLFLEHTDLKKFEGNEFSQKVVVFMF